MVTDFGKNYVRSWMHKDTISHCTFVTPSHAEYALLVSASIDGVIKLWQRRPPPEDKNSTDGNSLVLCRIFRVHESPLTLFSTSANCLVSGDLEGRICVFDVLAVELLSSFRVEGVPECSLLINEDFLIGIRDENKILLMGIDGTFKKEIVTPFPILHLAFNEERIWAFGNSQQILILEENRLIECQSCENLLSVSFGKKYFSLLNEQGILSVYKVRGVKLYRKYDLKFTEEPELCASAYASLNNVIFDEEEEHLLMATARGIQVINLKESSSVIVAGEGDDHLRFVNISVLIAPLKLDVNKELVYLSAEQNPTAAKFFKLRPLLVCTAFRKNRFYLFSPETSTTDTTESLRDMQNEYEEADVDEGAASSYKSGFPVLDKDWREYKGAWVRTNKGDLEIEFYHEDAPLAVQNFIHLARTGKYNNAAFHRVIRGFMVQTGDIDGNGGTSAWSKPFPDEFSNNNNHDRMGVVSMANAGKNHNGSQFFITTTNDKCTWLDGKHTIFAQVIKGLDVLSVLEKVETNRKGQPLNKIEMLRVDLIKK